MEINEFLSHFERVRKSGKEWSAQCPAHEDGTNSLGISNGNEGRILLNCRAGCEIKEILSKTNLSLSDLFPASKSPTSSKIIAIYPYFSANGTLLYQVVRMVPKNFRQRRPDGNGGWLWNMKDTLRVLYRLPDVLAAKERGETVYLVEGEKDVEALVVIGLTATTNTGGAGKWPKSGTSALTGCHVVILPDNDEPGRKHAAEVMAKLSKKANSVRIINLPGLPEKGDVSDWLNSGGTLEDLKTLVNEKTEDPEEREKKTTIKIVGGNLPEIVNQAEKILLKINPMIFQRSNAVVKIISTTNALLRPIFRPLGTPLIRPIESQHLVELLTLNSEWLKFDAKIKGWKNVDCPKIVPETYLSRKEWRLPHLLGIIESPTLRADGSILEKWGYDAITGLFFNPGSTVFPPIPENPSLFEAQELFKYLKKAFGGFPFVSAADLSVAISALMTALLRRSLHSAPLHGITAPTAGTGKSLLVDTIAMIVNGRPAQSMSQPENPEEEKKRLLAILLDGDPLVVIDNISREFSSDSLCTILTQSSWKERLLGVNETATVPTSVLFMATGNNLRFRGDLNTRVVVCHLDAKVDRPEEREFKVNLYHSIPQERGGLVYAALTILRAFHMAGRPKQKINMFGRFEEWSDWVRSAIIWVGGEDPHKNRDKIAEGDTERSDLQSFLQAWYGFLGSEGTTIKSVEERCNNSSFFLSDEQKTSGEQLKEELKNISGTKNGEINPKKIGEYLARNKDRFCGNLRLERVGKGMYGVVWRVSSGENSL